jgi:hypothetical protein
MKYFKLFIASLLLISCTKEIPPEDHDRFIGTWYGKFKWAIPGIQLSREVPSIEIIKKTDDPNLILFFRENESPTAKIDGNSYTYIEYTTYDTINRIEIAMTITGMGSISDDFTVIQESGEITAIANGHNCTGTWSCTRYKQ